MNRIHIYTGIGFVFMLTAAMLVCVSPVAAAVYCLMAYFSGMKEVSKYTSAFQFVTVCLAALVLGLSLEWPLVYFPALTLSCLFVAAGSLGRMIFFRSFGYTGRTWFEPLMLILALVFFLAANLLHPLGWKGWVFPLPILAFQGIFVAGILKDKIQLLGFTKGGYKIAIGAEAPEFSLPDQDGKMVSLSSFRGQRNLILVFVRGDWCPGCHMMLRTYQKEAEKFRSKNIFAVAIGPDPVGVNREMVEKLGLDFRVLSDEKQRTAMIYGVQLDKYDNDFAEKYEEGIPLPASFLVDKQGVVRYVSRPDKVGEFLDPRTIFPIIDNLH
jgi:peroxiredoxin Q/BCP